MESTVVETISYIADNKTKNLVSHKSRIVSVYDWFGMLISYRLILYY